MFTLAFFSTVLGVVALGPQVVLGSFKFNFSPVVQCAPVSVSFTGSDSNNHSVPTTLTVLPLVSNAVPIQIPIPNGASNSTGIELSFIPLPPDTTFVATLDAADGPASRVSDITRVLPANETTGSSDCLASAAVNTRVLYVPPASVSQCNEFTVRFNDTDAAVPTVSAYNPRGKVVQMPTLSVGPGVATYMMVGVRGEQVVILLNDTATGRLQTSSLLTIAGDSGSSTDCFPKKDKKGGNNNDDDNGASADNLTGPGPTTKAVLPDGAIIGIAIGAVLFVLAAMILLWYLLRRRSRNRRASNIGFDPTRLNSREMHPDPARSSPSWYVYGDEKSDLGLVDQRASPAAASFNANAPISVGVPLSGGMVRDPIYTDDEWRRSAMTDASSVRTSISSWKQDVPMDQRSPVAATDTGAFPTPNLRRKSTDLESRLSVSTVDMQNILQMATVHQDTSPMPSSYGKRTPQPSTAGTTMTSFDVAKPPMARLVPNRSRTRTSDPPDLPQGVSPLSRNNSGAVAINGSPMDSSYATLAFRESEYGYAIGTPAVGEEHEYPLPTFRSTQRDTNESWGNTVIR